MHGRPCRQCGNQMNRSHPAVYCFPCANQRIAKRIAAPDRERHGTYKSLRLNGRWCCLDCKEPVQQPVYGGKKRRPPLRCESCTSERWLFLRFASGRSLAATAISLARKRGLIPAPTNFACVDCNRPAECYDHRDYNEPMRVEPVCRSCNVMRGPGAPFNPYLVGLLLAAEAARAEPKAA